MSDSAEVQPYKYNGPIVKMLRSFDQMRFSDAADQIGPAINSAGIQMIKFVERHPGLTAQAVFVASMAVAVSVPMVQEIMANVGHSFTVDYMTALSGQDVQASAATFGLAALPIATIAAVAVGATLLPHAHEVKERAEHFEQIKQKRLAASTMKTT